MRQEFETIQWSFDESRGVGRIVLDRPDSLNALSGTIRREIIEGFAEFERLDEAADGVAVRAVVVSGAGDAFCAGADVTEFAEGTELTHPELVYEAPSEFAGPVVAEIDGYCLGGGLVFALHCDIRLASERSEFGLPEVDLGIPAIGGGLGALRATVGPGRAKRLAVTGERVDAEQAATDGIVDEVYSRETLSAAVDELVDTIASKPPLAVRSSLDIVDAYRSAPPEQFERRESQRLRESEDYREAVAAFREDREPEFTGQ
ncbi:enoyl-CoA hydratase/isomerase family protein [Natrinema caseinilyticum]|uniref:enoyl-CoA hydratase/isomerase family protein n=1 Tax=Natrinema caseinilyticum TaxID=2961570 RepID=UPI0020C563DE|nr:enoyl-CoA hydratase/isomerase family protein [Natrinema caseinilyticum]